MIIGGEKKLWGYPLVNKHRPWKSPMFNGKLVFQTLSARVYVNLPEGIMYYGRIPRTACYPQISGRPGSSFSVVTIPTTLALEETKRLLQQCPCRVKKTRDFFHQKCCFFMGFHKGKYGEYENRVEYIYIYVCMYVYIYIRISILNYPTGNQTWLAAGKFTINECFNRKINYTW